MIKKTMLAAAALVLAFGVSAAQAGGRHSGGGYHGGSGYHGGGYRGGHYGGYRGGHGYYGRHHHHHSGLGYAIGGAFLGAALAAPFVYAPPVAYYPAPVYGYGYGPGYYGYRPYYRYGYRW